MFVVNNYTLAVVFCFVTMLCWGSWGNTQKLASKSWRYELFYWDYVIGMLLFSILSGFTLGSFGSEGRSFVADLEMCIRDRCSRWLPSPARCAVRGYCRCLLYTSSRRKSGPPECADTVSDGSYDRPKGRSGIIRSGSLSRCP